MTDKRTYLEFIREVAEQTGAGKRSVHRMIRELRNIVEEELLISGKARTVGLGTFRRKWVQDRMGRNPVDGEPMMIPAHWKIKFDAEQKLKTRLNTVYESMSPEPLSEPGVLAADMDSDDEADLSDVHDFDVIESDSESEPVAAVASGIEEETRSEAISFDDDDDKDNDGDEDANFEAEGDDYSESEAVSDFDESKSEGDDYDQSDDVNMAEDDDDELMLDDSSEDDADDETLLPDSEELDVDDVPSLIGDEDDDDVETTEVDLADDEDDADASDDADEESDESDDVIAWESSADGDDTDSEDDVESESESESESGQEDSYFVSDSEEEEGGDFEDEDDPVLLVSEDSDDELVEDDDEFTADDEAYDDGVLDLGDDDSSDDNMFEESTLDNEADQTDEDEDLSPVDEALTDEPVMLDAESDTLSDAERHSESDAVSVGDQIAPVSGDRDDPVLRSVSRGYNRKSDDNRVLKLVLGLIGIAIVGWFLFALMMRGDQPSTTTQADRAPKEVSRVTSVIDKTTQKPAVQARTKQAKSAAVTYTSYSVKRGDSLWTIADREYGDPYLWPILYVANKYKISNPDVIISGDELAIPNLTGTAGSLSRFDRERLAAGNLEIYFVKKAAKQADAVFFLWVANENDRTLIRDYSNTIDQQDIRRIKRFRPIEQGQHDRDHDGLYSMSLKFRSKPGIDYFFTESPLFLLTLPLCIRFGFAGHLF